MKKIILVLIAIIGICSCSSKNIEVKELPQKYACEVGCTYYQENSDIVVFSDGIKSNDDNSEYTEGAFMLINDKVEKFEEITKSGNIDEIIKENNISYQNNNYIIQINKEITEDVEETGYMFKGIIKITDKNTNTSKIINVEGYCGC